MRSQTDAAARAVNIEQLQQLLDSFTDTEPKVIDMVKALVGKRLLESMPRLRASVLETGVYKVSLSFDLDLNLTPGQVAAKLTTRITPPVYEVEDQARIGI